MTGNSSQNVQQDSILWLFTYSFIPLTALLSILPTGDSRNAIKPLVIMRGMMPKHANAKSLVLSRQLAANGG